MAFDQVVKIVNAQLKAERADAEGHRESPRMLRILDSLIMLTSDDDEAQDLIDKRVAEMPVPKCKHEHIDPETGACKDCKKQIFTSRLQNV